MWMGQDGTDGKRIRDPGWEVELVGGDNSRKKGKVVKCAL